MKRSWAGYKGKRILFCTSFGSVLRLPDSDRIGSPPSLECSFGFGVHEFRCDWPQL